MLSIEALGKTEKIVKNGIIIIFPNFWQMKLNTKQKVKHIYLCLFIIYRG